ncbi:MAG: aldo/keto reductase [Spirochaetia bacterium]|jgi:predicted aldo/keto reductase-like oxidoreductase|nr:aldo/keto reductase [Spirochaetia bacterium]
MAYLGEGIRKLGFGFMRLPMKGTDVDIEQTKEMVDLFLGKGFTYFDTAYGYLGGKSEEAIKIALVDRYPREKFQLATKLPAWEGASTTEEARNMFFTSLKRTGAGYFDFYLLHNLGDERTEYFDRFGIWDFVQEQKRKGLIRHVGFSFHDKADVLDALLIAHPEVEFVQLQINYADWGSDSVQSHKCYDVARKHGKPVVIMEPVKGGSLADLPPKAASVFRKTEPEASVASWALRYVASLEGLITVLSGMSTLDQVKDNVATFEHFKSLDASERETIEQVRNILDKVPKVPCTDCRYCREGCPQGIDIPGIFSAMNNFMVFDNLKGAKGSYSWATRKGSKASSCIACGQCESVCPQHIPIIEELKKATVLFE